MIAYGLDLSLTNPAVCAIPLDWDCDMRRVQVWHLKTPEYCNDDRSQSRRRDFVANWVRALIVAGNHVAIESLPTHGAFAIVPLAKLHGVVCDRLMIHDVRTAPQATARTLFMGNMPRADIKETVRRTVQSFMGCASWTSDECDAFVVANWLVSELGAPCLMAPRIETPKPKRVKKAKVAA